MAKKNSSKTATEKAIQSSEPRVMTYRGWQGVNFVDAPLTWNPLETGQNKFRESDLPDNFLLVQNNLNTTDTASIETRMDSERVGVIKPGMIVNRYDFVNGEIQRLNITNEDNRYTFTGVSTVYKNWLLCVVKYNNPDTGNWSNRILYRDLNDDHVAEWNEISIRIGTDSHIGINIEIYQIGFFENNLVATGRNLDNGDVGVLLLAKFDPVYNEYDELVSLVKGMNWSTGQEDLRDFIVDTPKISPSTDRPGVNPEITVKGMNSWDPTQHSGTPPQNTPIRIQVKFCYTNRLGSTLTQSDSNCATMYVEYSPALWSTSRYVQIKPAAGDTVNHVSVTGIDFYARDDENLDWVFVGHINVTNAQVTNGTWSYNWYGNMTDITQWLTSQLMVPTDNTTHGPDASYFDSHDSRMYFWGMPSKPYRLWIGGNPGSEFSIARGLGGAWVDIEPGSGYDVKGTAKWKTTSGANIVTILCGNQNTTKIKRFNLIETNLTLTNEVAYKSYMYEEVSNVVGCNSRWGYGVFDDGLYSLNRYGLMLTTMAAEYNNQMKNQKVSGVIDPIFTDRIGAQLSNGRMVCINGIIYIALSEEQPGIQVVTSLDNVILCYDIGLKSWYTWTHDQTLTDPDNDKILHIFAIDNDEWKEGLGAITQKEVRLYPVTGVQNDTVPAFQVLMETGELAPRQPVQAFWYLQQLEFRFDYLVGDPDDPAEILVEGVDYYGRQFKIRKKINIESRGHHGKTGEQRNYVEWIRIDKIVESFRIRIKGRVRFRLTHINAKLYQQADTIGTPYGFDAQDTYYNRKGEDHEIHHYIDDYNNLRRAVIS